MLWKVTEGYQLRAMLQCSSAPAPSYGGINMLGAFLVAAASCMIGPCFWIWPSGCPDFPSVIASVLSFVLQAFQHFKWHSSSCFVWINCADRIRSACSASLRLERSMVGSFILGLGCHALCQMLNPHQYNTARGGGIVLTFLGVCLLCVFICHKGNKEQQNAAIILNVTFFFLNAKTKESQKPALFVGL